MELILTGDRIGAEEAVRIGLASRAVPHGELMAEARKVRSGCACVAAVVVCLRRQRGQSPFCRLPTPRCRYACVPPAHHTSPSPPPTAPQVAAKIASHSAPAVAKAKECVAVAQEAALGEGLRFEKREFWSCFALEDQKEGMAAFVQKRAPQWVHK